MFCTRIILHFLEDTVILPKLTLMEHILNGTMTKKVMFVYIMIKIIKIPFIEKFSNLGNKHLSYLTKVNYADEENNWKYGSRGCRIDTSPYSSFSFSIYIL